MAIHACELEAERARALGPPRRRVRCLHLEQVGTRASSGCRV